MTAANAFPGKHEDDLQSASRICRTAGNAFPGKNEDDLQSASRICRTGRLHSVETFGTVDGPGIRYVAFLQGCPLQCAFCHNPDSWDAAGGRPIEAEALVADMLRYRPFLRSGGVTLSGGEPLLQPDFVLDVLRRIKDAGMHTAIDTSGAVLLEACREAVDMADLILLDIKHADPEKCRALTGQDNRNAFRLLAHCEKTRKRVWIRHVVVPGQTDDFDDLEHLAARLSSYTCIERIEILPFHKMGEYKWKELNRAYRLTDTPEPDPETIDRIRALFARYGLEAA